MISKRNRRHKFSVGKFYRINQYIKAKEVRVVDESGKQVGVMPIFNAVQKAREEGKDLVEVAPNAQPPVAKIIDFKKFKYLEAKKEREEKKGQKGGELKEVQFTPFMAQNDFETRIKKVREFLGEGSKVRIRVRFKGRQITKKDFGFKIIDKILLELGETARKEGEARSQGREIYLILAPEKQAVKKKETKKEVRDEKEDENQKVARPAS